MKKTVDVFAVPIVKFGYSTGDLIKCIADFDHGFKKGSFILYGHGWNIGSSTNWQPHQLIVCDDSEIRQGDTILIGGKTLGIVGLPEAFKGCLKVIGMYPKLVGIPELPLSFVKDFAYNPDSEVVVTYDVIKYRNWTDTYEPRKDCEGYLNIEIKERARGITITTSTPLPLSKEDNMAEAYAYSITGNKSGRVEMSYPTYTKEIAEAHKSGYAACQSNGEKAMIAFAEWMRENYMTPDGIKWRRDDTAEAHTSEELLSIYKNTKE